MKPDTFLKEIREFFLEFIKLFIPNSKSEWIHFILLSTLYLSFSWLFVFNTSLLDHPELVDILLGFDNQLISRRGFPIITMHPFMALFSAPPSYLGDLIAMVFGSKGKTLFLVIFCTYLVVQSQVIVRRYLKKVIGLNNRMSNVIAIFFAFFAYNFVLSMTYEHFTFSLLLICATTYYFSTKIKGNKVVSFGSGFVLSLTLGGITISNIGKVLSVYFFDKSSLKITLKKQIIIFSVYAILYAGLQLVLIYVFNRERFLELFTVYDMFAEAELYSSNEFVQTVISRFIGAPILWSDYMIVNNRSTGPWTTVSNYTEIWKYVTITLILALLIWSIISNRKNKIVLFITFNFFLDILIHVIFKFGIGEGFIYAGHWIIIFPILIGWLIKSGSNLSGKIVVSLIIIVTIVLAVNNFLGLYEYYYEFGLKNYATQ